MYQTYKAAVFHPTSYPVHIVYLNAGLNVPRRMRTTADEYSKECNTLTVYLFTSPKDSRAVVVESREMTLPKDNESLETSTHLNN